MVDSRANLDFLDTGIYSTRSKISRGNLEEALLLGERFKVFFGYKEPGKALKRIFPNTPDKSSNELWETYLRRKCGLALCSGCNQVLKLENVKWWKCKECAGKWQKENSEKVRKYKHELYLRTRDTTEYKNAHKYTQNKRRAAKLQRTVNWADEIAIKKIYNECPEGYHVDHIVPLQGKEVSGLHVENNLQYLTASENLRKGNNYSG